MAAALETVLTFFLLLTPFTTLSVFIGMTADWDAPRRRTLAVRTTTAIWAVCLVLFFFGNPLFAVLGITLDAFRIGAGGLLFIAAARMVQGMPDSTGTRDPAADQTLAVVPLAVPVTVGPGTTGALLVLGAESHGAAVFTRCLSLTAAILAVGIILYAATAIERLLGKAGVAIISRLSGLFLAALAAQLVVTGIRNVLMPAVATV